MSNFQVYRKTLVFSLIMFLIDIIAMFVVAGSATIGFFVMNNSNDRAIIGLIIGLVIGIILAVLIEIFIRNRVKAAQISMITMGVVEGKMPDNVVSAGFSSIKGRFGKITGFYFVTSLIKGVLRQLGRGIERVGKALGGDVGESVSSAINSAIEVVIGYLCDCVMGWILYRKDKNGFMAGCEGAVIFFKHGKALIKNIGRIFGIGLLSLAVVGGAFFGLFYLIFNQFPQMFTALSREIIEIAQRNNGTAPEWISNVTVLTLIASGIAAIVIWSSLHSVLIRPFILVGVLRNFMAAGIKDIPTENDIVELQGKSPKFARLYQRAQNS